MASVDDEARHEHEYVSSQLLSLPELTEQPTIYSGCCLALSIPLMVHFRTLLPSSPSLVLSVGSGFGLLEGYLVAEPYSLNVVGVEVEPSSNKYLPASIHRTVPGSRFLEPLAGEARTWLFIYPRRVGLVHEYLARYGQGSVEKIVWAGPNVDWDDYADCFSGWEFVKWSADEIGGRPWELIAVASKRLR